MNNLDKDSYVSSFLEESKLIIDLLPIGDITSLVDVLVQVKAAKGRIFFCGSGGGAGHSSHASCDFRKIAGIESYSVSDNVSELSARINDEGWETSYSEYLKVSNLNEKDAVFIFSVGGGDKLANISPNLVSAMDIAKDVGASIVGIVGRNGGHLRKLADASILVPEVSSENVTTQVEGFQALLWHMLVTHPKLNPKPRKWESTI
jgi:D-sedoheptulose 7-phosphate isomerase